MSGIDALLWLEAFGYRFNCEGSDLTFTYAGNDAAEYQLVRVNLQKLKLHKDEAIQFWHERQAKHEAWIEAYDEWCQTGTLAAARKVAAAAIEAGLPHYDTTAKGTKDLGAEGWQGWLQQTEDYEIEQTTNDLAPWEK